MLKVLLLLVLCTQCKAQTLLGFNQNSYPAYDNAVFMDSLIALNPDIIRYPGGKTTTYSDWQYDKPTLPMLAYMRERVGCDIMFVLNMNTSSLAYQLQMLDSAFKLGIPIKYVELGNEVNNIDNPLMEKFHWSGIEYGLECSIWASEIKARYPEAKIGVWGENKPYFTDWNNQLLSVYTPDAMVAHFYPVLSVIAPTGIIDSIFFDHWINKAFVRAGIDFTIPIWVTEYNLSPLNLTSLQAGQHKKGLIQMTNKLKSLGVQMLVMHSLSNDTTGALSVINDSTVRLRPTGRAFKKVRKSMINN